MLRFVDHTQMGRGIHDWLDSHFHFSFAEYFNPDNIHFGALRVINDDLVKPGRGFEMHPHRDMEIISYVVDGALTHGDSMGNRETLTRGQVQYMSAGTGVVHSEHNLGCEQLRFLQIWILPDAAGYEPQYGGMRFNFDERIDRWMPIAAWVKDTASSAPIKVHQDIHMYVTYLSGGKTLPFEVGPGRQAYMVLIEGEAKVGDIYLQSRDALEITEENIELSAIGNAHALIIEMDRLPGR
jgi:redox-sensitive bicupin YhaK (pirin superfamily)